MYISYVVLNPPDSEFFKRFLCDWSQLVFYIERTGMMEYHWNELLFLTNDICVISFPSQGCHSQGVPESVREF